MDYFFIFYKPYFEGIFFISLNKLLNFPKKKKKLLNPYLIQTMIKSDD